MLTTKPRFQTFEEYLEYDDNNLYFFSRESLAISCKEEREVLILL